MTPMKTLLPKPSPWSVWRDGNSVLVDIYYVSKERYKQDIKPVLRGVVGARGSTRNKSANEQYEMIKTAITSNAELMTKIRNQLGSFPYNRSADSSRMICSSEYIVPPYLHLAEFDSETPRSHMNNMITMEGSRISIAGGSTSSETIRLTLKPTRIPEKKRFTSIFLKS